MTGIDHSLPVISPGLNVTPARYSRRQVLVSSMGALAGAALCGTHHSAVAQESKYVDEHMPKDTPNVSAPSSHEWLPPGQPVEDYAPVIVPNGRTLPFKVVDGAKVFHLIAEEVYHEFAPGLKAYCWGYNGSVHGPVIEAVEGDRVRIFVTNELKAGTSVHWHGILLPNGMDGVGGLSQRVIAPNQTFVYEFTLQQYGTFQYHSHHDEMTQIGMGLVGLFIIHPRDKNTPRPDRDFALLLHEWAIEVGTETESE